MLMVRQNVEGLLGEAFRIIDSKSFREKRPIEIRPELLFAHDARAAATPARAPLAAPAD